MEMENGKLFVGGLSWDTTEDRLAAYFQTFGDVVEAVVMRDRTTGRTRGFGFVVFSDPSVAERVVKEKHTIDGRTVEAKKAVPREDQYSNRNNGSIQSPQSTIRTKKIFVGGLPSSMTESDFKEYFNQFGTITDVVVMYDHNTQRPRGFGFITYDSEEAVDMVLHKTFHELNGKMVEVKRAVPKELSPGPARSPLGGYAYGLNRMSQFLNTYTQGYNQSPIGSHGVRPERISPTAYLSNMEFENDINRYIGQIRYASGMSRNMLENKSGFFSRNPEDVAEYVGPITGNAGSISSLGGLGTIWGSSPISRQGRMNGSGGFASAQSYGQNIVHSARDFDTLHGNERSLLYNNPTWCSPSPELEPSRSINYGLGSVASEATPRNSFGYVGLL